MGLIIFGALLILFYALKLICPNFVVGVAETPSIVKFGNFVDRNLWACHLFNGITSYFVMLLYTCACCRIKCFNAKEHFYLFVNVLSAILVQVYLPNFALYYNFMGYLIMPLIICLSRKLQDFSIFYFTCICFVITTIAQCLSLEIRGIYSIISYPNTATYFVLLIDAYIWNCLLYLYSNYDKKGEQNG
jgi:hypothetical protein